MIHLISLGGGVQSSTMALMAAHGEISPMPKAAIFADTQAEPKSVYTWLDWLKPQLPFPVEALAQGQLFPTVTPDPEQVSLLESA
jgi:3'-phosphoadenosine 5'-phosphosulfate sulfotransferase (PAPS reductase)/FAD synthetase